MLQSRQLLEQSRYHLARLLGFGVGFVEPSEIGESVRKSKGGLDAGERGVDGDRANDLIGEGIASGVEVPLQTMRFPAEATEIGVGLRVLIAEIGVGGLNL